MIYNITEQEYGTSRTHIKDFRDAELIQNMYIDDNGQLRCREGLTQIHSFAQGSVRGIMSCIESGAETLYIVSGTGLYRAVRDTGTGVWGSAVSLGTLDGGDAQSEVTLYKYGGNLYICGGEYWRYDGSTLSAVEGYVPLIRRYSGQTNYGQAWEPMNLLTNRVRMRFCPDGSSKKFKLYGSVASIDAVYFNGTQLSQYTPTVGAASYVELPVIYATNADDLLEVWYTLSGTSRRAEVTSCIRSAVYGGEADTRVMLYGGSSRQAMYMSEPDYLGSADKSRAEYFPTDNIMELADSNAVIKDILCEPDCIDLISETNVTRYDMTNYVSDGNADRLIPAGAAICDVCGSMCNGGSAFIGKDIYTADYAALWRLRRADGEKYPTAEAIAYPSEDINSAFIAGCRMHAAADSGLVWLYNSESAWIYDTKHGCWYKYGGLEAKYAVTSAGSGIIVSSGTDGDIINLLDSSVQCSSSCSYKSRPLDLGDIFEQKLITALGVSTLTGSGTEVPAAVLILDSGSIQPVLDDSFIRQNSGNPAVYSAALTDIEGYHIAFTIAVDPALGGIAEIAVDSEPV